MWIKNNEIYITHSEIRAANPQISMPKELTDTLIADLGYEIIYPTDRPDDDVVEELPPAFNELTQRWEQQWSSRAFTEQEIADNLAVRRAEMIVTPRQARLALLSANKLSDVETAITSLEEPMRTQVSIEWEYASTIERTSSWVIAMTESLGMTPEEVDVLFEQAKEL